MLNNNLLKYEEARRHLLTIQFRYLFTIYKIMSTINSFFKLKATTCYAKYIYRDIVYWMKYIEDLHLYKLNLVCLIKYYKKT